jgi:hypothetical protein
MPAAVDFSPRSYVRGGSSRSDGCKRPDGAGVATRRGRLLSRHPRRRSRLRGRRIHIGGGRRRVGVRRIDIAGRRNHIGSRTEHVAGRRIHVAGGRRRLAGRRIEVAGRRNGLAPARIHIACKGFTCRWRKDDLNQARTASFCQNSSKRGLQPFFQAADRHLFDDAATRRGRLLSRRPGLESPGCRYSVAPRHGRCALKQSILKNIWIVDDSGIVRLTGAVWIAGFCGKSSAFPAI